MKRTIGFGQDIGCTDEKEYNRRDTTCALTGTLALRGKIFQGTVVSDKMDKTVKVQWERTVKVGKYNRYLRKKSVVLAHNSPAIGARKGDVVLIAENRPLSKRKHFSVIKVISK